MRTVCTEIFKFDELSDEAKKKALNAVRYNFEYPHTEENRASLEAFAEEFNINVKDWQYGYRKFISWESENPTDVDELSGKRLLSYLHNNFKLFSPKYYGKLFDCEVSAEHPIGKAHKKRYSKCLGETYNCPLTGVWIDNALMDPIWKFITSEGFNDSTTLHDLLGECLNSWVNACDSDYDSCFEDEYLTEHIEANEYEFHEDGSRY